MKSILNFIDAQMDTFRSGHGIHATIAFLLQIAVVATAYPILRFWFVTWNLAAELAPGFFGWVAVVLWQAAFLAASFLSLRELYRRLDNVRELPDRRYDIAPMFGEIIHGVGEAVFLGTCVMAVPACIVVWSSRSLARAVFHVAGARFLDGVFIGFGMAVFGLVTLVSTYFLAELLTAFFDIAENTAGLKKAAPAPAATPDEKPASSSAPAGSDECVEAVVEK